ncbi:MAG: cytochrome c biogenesis protein CcsA [Armatimonadota bacterium]|nr:cytochrome c biogenesis protein CcsA [Armatimonadota bacterium]
MVLGTLLIWLCWATTLVAIIGYISGAANKRNVSIGRAAYYAMTTGVVIASAYLMVMILNHRFDIHYIMSYSSTDLQLNYLISAFWAGQEGSFLLWALFGAIIGLFLAAKSKDYEPWLMAFWCTVQAFFFTLLIVKSPFAATPQGMLMQFPDGQGLNPLLQNFWMAIHPPLVFLGYAAMAAPAAFVIAALIKGDYQNWSNRCLPWALFAWLTLGAGIIIGSFWAYEVLGWGGYWGWDPVENASLVPWISGTALLHGMLVERYRGSMRRTNMVLALLSFLLVVYATFLTRSGVLGDFSVHSFSDLGTNAYLIGFLVFFTVLCAGLLIWRAKKIESRSWYGRLDSKEFVFFIAIISLSALALLVLVGTSSPIFTKLIMSKPDSVGPDYYAMVSSPIAIVLLIALALVPILPWASREKSTSSGVTSIAARINLLVALVVTAVIFIAMQLILHKPVSAAVAAIAIMALAVNLRQMCKYARGDWKMIAGSMAHVGIALMLMGMAFSPSMQQPHRLVLSENGDSVSKLGYDFSYKGLKKFPNGTQAMRIGVEKDGKSFLALPEMRPTNDGMMHKPHIHHSLLKDLYIAPSEVRALQITPVLKPTPSGNQYIDAKTPDGGADIRLMGIQVDKTSRIAILLVQQKDKRPQALQLEKGRSGIVGNYTFKFDHFDMSGGHGEGGEMQVGAVLSVNYPGASPSAVIEVSIKKLISLLWLGSILALLGGSIAIFRRVRENRKIL